MQNLLLQLLFLGNSTTTRTQKHSYIYIEIRIIYIILVICNYINFYSSFRQKYQIVEKYKNILRMKSQFFFFHYMKHALWTDTNAALKNIFSDIIFPYIYHSCLPCIFFSNGKMKHVILKKVLGLRKFSQFFERSCSDEGMCATI